jgi:hypothetical protein
MADPARFKRLMTLTTMATGTNDLKQVWVFIGARNHFPSAIFILLRAGYSTHKRFVLGGEECARPFPSRSVVAH